MSTVSNLSSLTNTAASTSTSSSSSSSTSSSTASSDASSAYNTFLTLLTTELKNQNPLDPTNTSDFTNQLISLANVEQQEAMNSQLTTISNTLNSYGLSNGVAYLNQSITFDDATTALQSGSANWNYTLSGDAAKTTLTVTDSSGDTVWSASGDTTSGSHAFSWNGTDSDGVSHTSGAYTLTVTATDSSGKTVSSTVSSIGTVTGLESVDGSTELQIGDDVTVALADVTGVRSATN
jgi:flagellar basal-body rod modification protein FlgD